MLPSLVIPTAIFAVGLFLLSIGGDALKVADLGVRFLPIQWLVEVTSFSYRVVGYSVAIGGFALLFVAAEICRRADKRVVAATPGVPSPRSIRFAIVPGGLIAMLGWALVNTWFRR